MPRKGRGAPFAKERKLCLFCGGPGLSKTHIWPKWLNELLAPPPMRRVELDRPEHSGRPSECRVMQGSIFSQKPYLACEACNHALGRLEDEMKKFAPALFLSTAATMRLGIPEQRTLAGWVAAIAILAEHTDKSRSSLAIPERDVAYVRENLTPPVDWTIVCASQRGKEWAAKYKHRTTFVGQFHSEAEFWEKVRTGADPNTQLTSFGAGGLFFQVFTCPDPRFVGDFRRCAEDTGLNLVWPLRRSIFVHRTIKFPTVLVLTDETAASLADTYMDRLRELTTLSV